MLKKAAEKSLSAFILVFFAAWFCLGLCLPFSSKKYAVENIFVSGGAKIRKTYLVQDGWMIWLKEGKDGVKKAVFDELGIFGKKISAVKIFESGFVKKPVEGIAIKGLAKKANAITVKPVTYALTSHRLEATAYDPSPEANGLDNSGITYLGWRTRFGIAAVDPKVISLRSLLYVEGYGFAWAGDIGGDIKGNRIDLCYNTSEEAFKWGRKKVYVYVLGTRPPSYYSSIKKKAGQNKK